MWWLYVLTAAVILFAAVRFAMRTRVREHRMNGDVQETRQKENTAVVTARVRRARKED
ncbi:hypothetical protein BCY84_17355 [Trypanosoma cruzi cruzi]|nr:hypothetical protein BCY84_17355 [Trypanosoma cruzi cruzi]